MRDLPAVGQSIAVGVRVQRIGFEPDHVDVMSRIRPARRHARKRSAQQRAVDAIPDVGFSRRRVGERVAVVVEFSEAERVRVVERAEHDEVSLQVGLVAVDDREIDAAVVVRVLRAVGKSVAVGVGIVRIGREKNRVRRQLRAIDARRVVNRRRVRDDRRDVSVSVEKSNVDAPKMQRLQCRRRAGRDDLKTQILDAVVESVVVGVGFVRIGDAARDEVGARLVQIVRPRIEILVARGSRRVVGRVVNRRIEVGLKIRNAVAVGIRVHVRVAGRRAPAEFEAVAQSIAVGFGRERIRFSREKPEMHLRVRPRLGVRCWQCLRGRFKDIRDSVVVVVGLARVRDELPENDMHIARRNR